ncbi:HNH endonuclease [Anaerobacillus sp. 1_MG-2023]|uniref:HNH endonuclease n=1 Tax=Bacillales TaxID=1385 RepID=UPI0026E32BFF|nr:HNH endonuclease [Anaerobacillus sp. 1_MG-2023]MDO6658478.1 HNH endonuclease [Anaerobacillus sp. 1_MG-2023]
MDVCELCGRTVTKCTLHHLTPREEGGSFKPTAWLCVPCHKQIHALYTNKELAIRLNTITQLKEDDRIRRYLKWIKKQPGTKSVKTKKANSRKQKK